MKIWILNHYASLPDRPAGTRHFDFGRVLAGQGHDVTIFASSFSHHSLREERLAPGRWLRSQRVDGVRFVWLRTVPYDRNGPRRVLNILSYTAGVLLAQWRFARPDVVVGSSVHPGAAVAGYLIARARRVPFVFEVRDLWPQALIDMGVLPGRSLAARLLRLLERFLYRRARVVISLLPRAAGYITRAGIPAEKIIYIPNGFAPAPPGAGVPSPPLPAVLAGIEKRRQAGCLVAGYTGAHGLANGLPSLLEAARRLRDREVGDIALVFVGEGPAKPECERLASGHGLTNVDFYPPVAKREVPAVLRTLDVTLFPLRDESVARYGLSSNKLFDYLASGRPVLSCCGVPDNPVQLSGGGLCVPAESPGAVADALLAFAAMGEPGRRQMGEKGRRWVQQEHSVTGLAGRFLDAMTAATRPGGPPPRLARAARRRVRAAGEGR